MIQNERDKVKYTDAMQNLVNRKDVTHLSGLDTFPVKDLRTIEGYIARIKSKYGLDIVFLDYLQKLAPLEEYKRNDQHEQIQQNMFRFSQIVKDYDVLGINIAQLRRVQEDARKNPPKMTDLKGSSAIEDESVMVSFLHTPFVNDEFQEDTRLFYAEKARYGKRFKIPLEFHGESMNFIGRKIL